MQNSFSLYLGTSNDSQVVKFDHGFSYFLPSPLHLVGKWRVKLCGLDESREGSLVGRSNFIYVLCNLSEPALFLNEWLPVLGFFPIRESTKGRNKYISYNVTDHEAVPIRNLPDDEIREIRIWFLDEKGEPFSKIHFPLRCALRFERAP